MTHLSLFTGIGGLDLAAEWAGFDTIGQCEIDEYATKVLEKHWPDVPRWRDIHDLRANEFFAKTGKASCTVVSGGFPCQPHSVAGLRKASADERDLWSEYRRVIGEIKPRWVVAENVRGLLSSEGGGYFRGICRDLSGMGYDAVWLCFRAADVGAIHARERIAIIAHNDGFCKERITEKQIFRKPDIQGCETERGIEDWTRRSNVFEPKLCRNYHGFSGGVDRIKCLGNSVVPQQFYPVFKAIADIEISRA